MSRKQLSLLFISNLIPYIMGNSFMALLPLYTQRLGADASVTGLYFAIAFALLAASTLSSGWLSNRFQRRKAFILGSLVVSVPAILLMGAAQDMIQLTIATSVVWFLFGIITTMVFILAGMGTAEHNRGRIFGTIQVAGALAQVIAGLIAGHIVELWGFEALFVVLAALYGLMIFVVLALVDYPPVERKSAPATSAAPVAASVNILFLLLLVAGIMSQTAHFTTVMTMPLVMDARGFAPSAITSTVAIGGLINLPLPLIIGMLSDRFGRRTALMVSYAVMALGIVLLIPAGVLWHFWVARILVSVTGSAQTVGSALTADIVEPEALSSSLSRYSAIPWIGAVISFLVSGVVIDTFGINPALVLGTVIAVAAIPLVYATAPQNRMRLAWGQAS